MGRPRKEMSEELKTLIAADIEAGVKRGKICAERGVSYVQLQQHFGFSCKKPRMPRANPSPVEDNGDSL